jgi:hypothetical protein
MFHAVSAFLLSLKKIMIIIIFFLVNDVYAVAYLRIGSYAPGYEMIIFYNTNVFEVIPSFCRCVYNVLMYALDILALYNL